MRNGNRVKFFSRNLENCNKKYNSIVKIVESTLDSLDNDLYLILDGEIVPYDYEKK